MITFGIGEAAALATAISWSASCLIHAEASSRLGATSMLLVRTPLALLSLGILMVLSGETHGYPLRGAILLLVSGMFGVALSDWCFYLSIQIIGVRAAQVCQSLYVSLAALMAALFLGENIGLQGALGIAIATMGIMLVIAAEGRSYNLGVSKAQRRKGVLLAFGSAGAFACGLILSREGLKLGVPPITAGFLRTLAAMMVFWSVHWCANNIKKAFIDLKASPKTGWLLVAGCVCGTGGGLWLSMVALANTQAAVASVLMGLQLVIVPFFSWITEHKRPNAGTFAGAGLAFAGTAVVLLR